ncbi:hypothetical protein LPJ66_000993 [Kickxella alabastrina]|uniref:Uncharacterized protein n=1 Tax=Kickxella alabastrina TaxID=61397 RepID=A0ACC1IUJ8_9FUNG|nr:hypothetical protein LPJ66_000993 [Kickxella alabastrina]
MKFSTFGLFVAAAMFTTMVDVGNALPARLERRDPVTKIIKYVIYRGGDDHHESEPTEVTKPEPSPESYQPEQRPVYILEPRPEPRQPEPRQPEPKPEVYQQDPKPEPAKPSSAPKPAYSPELYEFEMLCLVNKERLRVGLNRLALHPAMNRAAYEHSVYQSNARDMTHNDPDYGQLGSRLQRHGFSFASASENIAQSAEGSTKKVFDMWMNDPPHYVNIVDPKAKYMGLSRVNGFWTQDFGSEGDSEGASAYDASAHESDRYC